MTAAIGWASVLAYLAIGATYALRLSRRCSRDPGWSDDRLERAGVAAGVVLLGILWPITVALRSLIRRPG